MIFDRELGKQAHEERLKIQKMQMEGYAKKQEFINEGNVAIEEKKVRLGNVFFEVFLMKLSAICDKSYLIHEESNKL